MNTATMKKMEETDVIDQGFLADTLHGLLQHPKTLACKYFYDEAGSQLFENICETDDYYLTRTDIALLDSYIDAIAEQVGENVHLIELGSGAGIKIHTLLSGLKDPFAYTPIDISEELLFSSAKTLKEDYPNLLVEPVHADYMKPMDIEQLHAMSEGRRRVVFFPGSTISNFDPEGVDTFLKLIHTIAGPDGGLLIGVDLIKDKDILERAYNDSEGVTAKFNLNLLTRINSELGADFDLNAFKHQSIYNEQLNRIEMHLISLVDQQVSVQGHHIHFKQGESIHTENSYKFSIESFQETAKNNGFTPEQVWVDGRNYFSIHYLSV